VILFGGPHPIAHGLPSIDLAAVGDIMLGRWVGAEITRHGPDYPFTLSRRELRHADLAVGNLECVLGSAPFAVRKRFLLRGNSLEASVLKRAGFAALTLANNHSLDCGPTGLSETLKALSSAHVSAFGAVASPSVLTRKGVRIAFLGYCDFPNDSGGSGICYTNEARLRADISSARQVADIVVVFWHWGVELSSTVSPRQRHLARLAAADGADVVFGAHPHVLQPIEWIRRPYGRRCLIAYSLGNFVFDAHPGRESRTEILHVILRRDGVRGYRVTPYRIVDCRPGPSG
jgi:poly-gamma-glutamate synthesis protein (capsule biosynthesis protein)